MEIIVEGKSEEFFTPDEIILNIDFIKNAKTYEEVLRDGSLSVESFIQNFLIPNGFQKEDLKTRSFVIREETRYDNQIRKEVFECFSYNQNATLKFPYDKQRLANLMISISKLEDAPNCRISFGIQNEKECRRKILSKAYKDAEEQAYVIAQAANKTLQGCLKVDFKPFTSQYCSPVYMNSDMMYAERLCDGSAQTIANIFTPEDIQIKETVYCLWIAE